MKRLTKPEILITKKFPDHIIAPLVEIGDVHQWDRHIDNLMPREEVLQVIGRMSAVINQGELKVDESLLMEGGKLKIVANVAAGFDNLSLDLMTKYGVWASNTPGYFSYPVVEYIIGGIITVFRRLLEADQFVRKGEWQSFQPGRWDGESLVGKTMGIIGMGRIGEALAKLASCLGMKVIYHTASKRFPPYQWLPLEALLPQADVISVSVPYKPETHEMIAASQFSSMKPGVLFVNTSRGKVVNESDLVHFLETGHLGGAVIDVFMDEPSVPEILKTMPNVLLTPHIAGGTRSGRLACYQLAVDNVLAVLNDGTPINPLNNIK